MNRLFHCQAIGSLFVLAVATLAATAAGCAPDNDVKPGAPVLTKFIIIQPNYARTTIDSSTSFCPEVVASGVPCIAADNPDTADVEIPDALCQQGTTHDWCQCDASGAAPVWACSSFANVRAVASVFDRLLDTEPLAIGPTPADASSTTVTASVSTGTPPTLLTDYASNGSPTGLLLPFFAYYYYMNYRFDGPSLLTVPEVAFPSGTTVTITLNPTQVLAKDGTTPFTGEGILVDGTLSFSTPAFAVDAVAPDTIAPDMSTISVTFNNLVDITTVASHITVTASTTGAAVPVTMGAIDGNTIGVTPVTSWPAGATLTFTIDATAPNVLGQTLGAPATGMVTTSAS